MCYMGRITFTEEGSHALAAMYFSTRRPILPAAIQVELWLPGGAPLFFPDIEKEFQLVSPG